MCGARAAEYVKMPTGPSSGRPPVGRAARFADASAHRPVVMIASSTTVAPHPAMIHQPARLASAKPVRKDDACRAESTADPITATPSEVPTWRLVEAIAAATPECDRGMPDTALLVIAGFTMPTPMPKAR